MYAWISCSRTKPLFAFTCSLGGPNKRTKFKPIRLREVEWILNGLGGEKIRWISGGFFRTNCVCFVPRSVELYGIWQKLFVFGGRMNENWFRPTQSLKSGFFKRVVTIIRGFERPTLAGASSSWSLQANLVLESISWVLHSPTKQHCTNAVHVVHFYLFHL